MRTGVVPEPASQVEEEEEVERIRSSSQWLATAVQLSVAVQFSQRVVLRLVRTASSSDAASCRLPGLLLAVHDRPAELRPVPRLDGGTIGLDGRVRAAVVRQPVRRRSRQLLLDGGRCRARVFGVNRGPRSALPGRSDTTADRSSAAPPGLVLRSGRLGIARSDRM